ncbi:recQ-like DNA helicase BLM [Oenanthe melanoleuca]|uniref:recQ-like DNA helicase BLM n=1 Tax=Oenanthe melanoleuca TaxID=2939378 RepID=UPI0024C12AC3|nr:recQ-like DNA helicase BLM [Oenanthe melanoleuca]
MAAVPHNNLREQLRRHSARGALRAPAPPRDRPPGFTFKRAARGLAAAAVLRDKDVNAPPAGRAAARGCALPPSPAPSPGPSPGPAIASGEQWDDIDDFDLSGIEKFCRPPVVSPKGLRHRPGSQDSIICLGDSSPRRDLDSAAAAAGGDQEPPGAVPSPPHLAGDTWPLAGAELEEDDLDIIPPSPEEELPPFSPSVQSAR